jgi:hypothetical protein
LFHLLFYQSFLFAPIAQQKLTVPAKSPANCILPSVLLVALAVVEPATAEPQACCGKVEPLLIDSAVGCGVPVNETETTLALRIRSLLFTLRLMPFVWLQNWFVSISHYQHFQNTIAAVTPSRSRERGEAKFA